MPDVEPQASGSLGRVLGMVALAFVILMATNGFILAGPTVFDRLIQSQLHVSTAALRLRDTITVLTLGAIVPFVGYLLDRFPVRPILMLGLALCGVSLLGYGHVHTIWQIYGIHFVLGLAQATAGVVSCVYLVSGWTRVHRGAALGFVIAGSSLGNAAIPAFNTALLKSQSWGDAIGVGGLISLALIPLVFFVVREPRGLSRHIEMRTTHVDPQPRALSAVLGEARFWLLAIIATTTVFGVLALATNLALFATHLPANAGVSGPLLLFCLFGAAVSAQLLAGFATYRIGTRLIHAVALAMMLLGALTFAIASPGAMVISIMLFGLGWGANSCMLQVRPTFLFPGAVLGKVLSWLALAETLGGGFGPFFAGYASDHLGGFRSAFLLVSVVLIVPAAVSLLLGRNIAPPTVTV